MWVDYVPSSRRKEGCEDGGPWAIPGILGSRWVSSTSVVLEHCAGNQVEGLCLVHFLIVNGTMVPNGSEFAHRS